MYLIPLIIVGVVYALSTLNPIPTKEAPEIIQVEDSKSGLCDSKSGLEDAKSGIEEFDIPLPNPLDGRVVICLPPPPVINPPKITDVNPKCK